MTAPDVPETDRSGTRNAAAWPMAAWAVRGD